MLVQYLPCKQQVYPVAGPCTMVFQLHQGKAEAYALDAPVLLVMSHMGQGPASFPFDRQLPGHTQVDLMREKLELTPVFSTAMEHDGHTFGYIRLVSFSQKAAADTQHAIASLQASLYILPTVLESPDAVSCQSNEHQAVLTVAVASCAALVL